MKTFVKKNCFFLQTIGIAVIFFYFSLQSRSINGKILLFLKQVKREAPEFYYRCITEKLGIEDLEDIMNFTNVLAQLF